MFKVFRKCSSNELFLLADFTELDDAISYVRSLESDCFVLDNSCFHPTILFKNF